MSLILISPDMRISVPCGGQDDLVVQDGVDFIGGNIDIRNILTPESCEASFENLRAEQADFYGDVVVSGPAHIGEMRAHGDAIFDSGVTFSGPVWVSGDLIVRGGEMITHSTVVVCGRALFGRRPVGSGTIYCDDVGPADED